MSVATEIETLQTNIGAAYTTIGTMGGTVPQNQNTDNLATAIGSIPTGGGPVTEETALQYMLNNKTSYSGLAAGLATLTELPTFTQPSGIRNYSYMFYDCTNLLDVSPLSTASNSATQLQFMFYGCKSMTTIPSIDIDGAGNIESMFYSCEKLQGDFTISLVRNCKAALAFMLCKKINNVNITSNTGFLTTFRQMFYGCYRMRTISIPVTTSGIGESAEGMFHACNVLTSLTINVGSNSWILNNMEGMFRENRVLVSASINAPIDAYYCSSCRLMFQNCVKLTSLPTILNTQHITDFYKMFDGCTVLTDIPQYDMSAATSLGSYVTGCSSLSNTSLNNILGSLLTATSYTGTKTLKYIGMTSAQATTCTGLSNWAALSAAGWTTGY